MGKSKFIETCRLATIGLAIGKLTGKLDISWFVVCVPILVPLEIMAIFWIGFIVGGITNSYLYGLVSSVAFATVSLSIMTVLTIRGLHGKEIEDITFFTRSLK